MENADVQSWFGPDRKARRKIIQSLIRFTGVADATKKAMEKPDNPGIVHASLVNEVRNVGISLAEGHAEENSKTRKQILLGPREFKTGAGEV